MDDSYRDDVRLNEAGVFEDARGTLTLVSTDQIPFTVRRTYVLHRMPVGAVRGGHRNRAQRRLLVGLAGSATVTLDDGYGERLVGLAVGSMLLVAAGVWFAIENHDPDTAILVFADGDYDTRDQVAARPRRQMDAVG